MYQVAMLPLGDAKYHIIFTNTPTFPLPIQQQIQLINPKLHIKHVQLNIKSMQ